ncbi:MAG TPA: hypothetical protein ENO00_13345 [Deltaproteobacteria bacterium]|nr:hypothetical protein [Deltaproteobacteria bacterium]
MKKSFFLFAIMVVIGYASACCGLTVEEIIRLKNAGVSDTTIRMMLEQERPGVREYSDDRGNTCIRYSTGSSAGEMIKDIEEAEKMKRAWELLDSVIIDRRK